MTSADGVDYVYNTDWQMLEQRGFDHQAQPVGSQVYVWSPRYIDTPILRDTCDSGGTLGADERLYWGHAVLRARRHGVCCKGRPAG